MAQRPRLSQLKRNDVNFKTFKEQFESLEGNTGHFRPPVRTKGELPFDGNINGAQCLVVDEGVVYYWDDEIQNWQPTLGQVFKMDEASFQRWKKNFKATAGQQEFYTDVLFSYGKHEVDVFVNGILQDIEDDYMEVDNRTIRFNEGLPEGASVTIATPMVIQSNVNIEEYLARLEDIEFNSYQMMMSQYYDGKNFDAKGMTFDGFINTSMVDYSLTTSNIMYDSVKKSMYMFKREDTGIVEHFDETSNIELSESDVYIRGSEITLPITTAYIEAFKDEFTNQDLVDIAETNASWNREKGIMTNNDTAGGGDSYYKGDFMGETGNVDLVGFSEGISVTYRYWNGWDYRSAVTSSMCYGVLPMGSMNAIINSLAMIYRGVWPYNSYSYMYRDGSSNNNRTDGDYSVRGGSNFAKNIFLENSLEWRPATTYVRGWNQIVALKQVSESSGRYYQRLARASGRTQSLYWSWANRPSGLPNTLFGSQTNTFTQSATYISQIGSTYDMLLIRAGNILYFLDSNFSVVKTLDWSKATRKPSTYNVVSQQITADKRYLYFPARLLRDGYWGYYLEVFNIEDGSYVNEILVTRDNSGSPGTTAMGFDHDYNRLVLGQQGGYRYTLFGKSKNSISEYSSYAGMLIFEPQDERTREVVSKPFRTNLPYVYYRLAASQALNAGTIDYYIRFGAEAWTKINLNTAYTWTNPEGAAETTVQLRAVLRTTLTASKAPELTSWTLSVRPFTAQAVYRSKPKLINMDGISGGRLEATQNIPNESSLQWYVELDETNDRYIAGTGGAFDFESMTGDAYFVIEANLSTKDFLLSPVVKDVAMQLYRDEEGIMYTETSQQINDIRDISVWVTTSAGNDKYELEISRDNGERWDKAEKRDSILMQNGDIETNWRLRYNEIAQGKRAFKMRFILNGPTEIIQYGARID